MKTKIYLTLCISLFFTLSSCDPKDPENTGVDDIQKILETVEINRDFEQSPPIAQDMYIEILEKPLGTGENIRLVVEFDEDERLDEFLAINIGGKDEKVLLRNDGKGADIKQGDNMFSVYLTEDIDKLKEALLERQKILLSGDIPVDFTNRSIEIDANKIRKLDIEKFTIDAFKPGDLIRVPWDILLGGGVTALASEKTLMITDLGVVEDPTRTFNPCTGIGAPSGEWTFGELMRQMASPNPTSIASDSDVSIFVLNWLNTWMIPQTVNNEGLPARTQIQNRIITPWLARSLSNGAPSGELMMEFAPFKLTAIVNRLDLRGNSGYGFSDAGEGRFVFCALDNNCNSMEFNVIFEYGINKKSCASVKAFAQEWADLDGMTLGSATYNNALANITQQFSLSGTNTSKPNQNSINQVRTNEVALSGPWELREFNLNSSGVLGLVDVKMEPAVKYDVKSATTDVEILADFVNTNEADILNNNYSVPLLYTSSSSTSAVDFRGGKGHIPFPPTGNVNTASNTPHHWDGTTTSPHLINNDDARHIFSLNTCSGCHGGETQTFFTHIDPVPFGTEATLSGFLTGVAGRGGAFDSDLDPLNLIMSVNDPAGRPAISPAQRGFNDLERRSQDLQNLLNNNCIPIFSIALAEIMFFDPINMSH